MAYKTHRLWLAAAMIVPLAACNPAAPPSDPAPPPVVPPTTAAAASVATTVALQAANVDLPSQNQKSEQPTEQPVSCREDVGEPAAKRLVERCIAVSPATHPPCNAANPCLMITDEIKRSCDFFGPDEKPAECAA